MKEELARFQSRIEEIRASTQGHENYQTFLGYWRGLEIDKVIEELINDTLVDVAGSAISGNAETANLAMYRSGQEDMGKAITYGLGLLLDEKRVDLISSEAIDPGLDDEEELRAHHVYKPKGYEHGEEDRSQSRDDQEDRAEDQGVS